MPSISIEAAVAQLAWLLLGAALVGMLAHRLRLPYAVALVLVGLLVAAPGVIQVPQLQPDLLLFVLLPPLLFGRQVLGGVLIGTVLGLLFSRLTGAIDDHAVEMTLSNALADGSCLIAQ